MEKPSRDQVSNLAQVGDWSVKEQIELCRMTEVHDWKIQMLEKMPESWLVY